MQAKTPQSVAFQLTRITSILLNVAIARVSGLVIVTLGNLEVFFSCLATFSWPTNMNQFALVISGGCKYVGDRD